MNKTLTNLVSVLADIPKWPLLLSVFTTRSLRAIEAISNLIFSAPQHQVQLQKVSTKATIMRSL